MDKPSCSAPSSKGGLFGEGHGHILYIDNAECCCMRLIILVALSNCKGQGRREESETRSKP